MAGLTKKTFRGGVHPPDRKELSKDQPITDAPAPGEVVVPMSQHIGRPAAPCVKRGETVLRGQVIGTAQGFVSANIHSPVSGTVKKEVDCRIATGGTSPALLIESDGEDTWAEGCNEEVDVKTLDAAAIRDRVAAAGIVGLGGATFPTHVKLSPPENKPIDAVILNGVECEPYLTADYRLMIESPGTIVEGLKLVMRAVECSEGYIGVEANKPDAYKLFREACADASGDGLHLQAVLLEVKYPQGGEKQLIEAILGREVPSGGLPMDVGAVVQNVGTAHAIAEACRYNRPLTERIVTVTGEAANRPANYRARIGVPLKSLLEASDYAGEAMGKLVLGGPMMGLAQFDLEMPVAKGTSGILALSGRGEWAHRNCIRCGRCVAACAAHLMPAELSLRIESGNFADAQEINLLDCIECGGCTYVCPARRPIVQWIKLAKAELNKERLRKAAEENTSET
jgi:electron transport complex protein RnfC